MQWFIQESYKEFLEHRDEPSATLKETKFGALHRLLMECFPFLDVHFVEGEKSNDFEYQLEQQ